MMARFLAVLACLCSAPVVGWTLLSRSALPSPRCLSSGAASASASACGGSGGGGSGSLCRVVEDGFASGEEMSSLRRLARAGMGGAGAAAGPAIFDANSGMLRANGVFANVFSGARRARLEAADLAVYASLVERVRRRLAAAYNLTALHLTAPTFITRVVGAAGWRAADEHDEYYHAHADGLTTPHYAYSGLLYLSTYADDFTGGRFRFYAAEPPGGTDAPDDARERAEEAQEPLPPPPPPLHDGGAGGGGHAEDVIVEPRAGRLLLFSSGAENWHRLERVRSGERFVLSLWFTCDPRKRFASFLDGKAHADFDGGAKLDLGAGRGGGEL